jgi:predicted RNA-binding protein
VLVDALWRADMKWTGERRHQPDAGPFPIATYSGFWRPEIMSYIERVREAFVPTKDRCIVLPCAADKPYPAPIHRIVKDIAGSRYEIIAASTAIGYAPESMWPGMPLYDAGLPFFERFKELSKEFWKKHAKHYKKVIIYTDMLQSDIAAHVPRSIRSIPVKFPRRCDYKPLLWDRYLNKLRTAVAD